MEGGNLGGVVKHDKEKKGGGRMWHESSIAMAAEGNDCRWGGGIGGTKDRGAGTQYGGDLF